MTKVKLTTGIGYLVEKATGKIRAKFDLPPGEHEFDTTKYDVVEVSTRAELDAISVEPEITQEEQLRVKIRQLREQILEKLIEGDTIGLDTLRQQYKKLKQQLLKLGGMIR